MPLARSRSSVKFSRYSPTSFVILRSLGLSILFTFTLLPLPIYAIRWCARKGASYNGVSELEQCNKLVAILNNASTKLNSTLIPETIQDSIFTCVESDLCESIALKVDVNAADLVVHDARLQYKAAKEWGARPLVAQLYSTTINKPIEYYSVAVVQKDFCNNNTVLSDLKVRPCADATMCQLFFDFSVSELELILYVLKN